jgi:adenosylhomocysteine nucleosidase
MRIAILSGVAAEAAAFLPAQTGTTTEVMGLRLRSLSHAGHEVEIACCGVGKVNAALATTVIAHRAPDLILMIGTAGKLSALAGECFVIADAFQGDYGAARAGGFAPYNAGTWPIGPATLSPFIAMPLADIGLPAARIVSGDIFVESPTHAAWLRDTFAADLVDMETAAVAQAATQLNLRWAAIKATTDDVNGESAGDFQVNLARAARAAAAAAEQVISLM